MSSPWAKIEKPEPLNFEEIMSEQVATDLQAKEQKRYFDRLESSDHTISEAAGVGDIPEEVLKALSDDPVESDEIIARMLQMQFDKEYDDGLKREEKHFNGSSKVSISFDNYRRAPLNDGKFRVIIKFT